MTCSKGWLDVLTKVKCSQDLSLAIKRALPANILYEPCRLPNWWQRIAAQHPPCVRSRCAPAHHLKFLGVRSTQGFPCNVNWAHGSAGGTWLTWVSAAQRGARSTAQLLAQRWCCPAHLPDRHQSGTAAADAERPSLSLLLPGATLPAACHCSSNCLAQNPQPLIRIPCLIVPESTIAILFWFM